MFNDGLCGQGFNAALLLVPADEHHAVAVREQVNRPTVASSGTWAAGADRPDSSGQLDACVSKAKIGGCDMHSTKDDTRNPREKS